MLQEHIYYNAPGAVRIQIMLLEHINLSYDIEWQVFRFLKGRILVFSAIVVFTVLQDLTQPFLRNAMSESAEISRVKTYVYHLDK